MREMGGVRWWLPRVLLLFVLARVIVVACAAAAETITTPDPHGPGGSLLRADDRPVVGSLTGWDAVYYLDIAAEGYRAGPINGPYPAVVFFPLYPATTAAVSPLVGGDLVVAGLLVANLASLVGLVGAYLLARRALSERGALLAVALVALQPGAVAFSMAYSDGLFLALSVFTFLLSTSDRRGARVATGILGILCGLTRLQGALLVLPLLITYWRADGGRIRVSWLTALGPVLGLVAYCGFLGATLGDPLAPISAQIAWDFGTVAGAVADGWVVLVAAVIYAATAAVALRLLVDRWQRRTDPAGVSWALVNVLALAVARRIASLPRYLAPVVQLAEEFASGRRSPRFVRLVMAGSVAAYTVLALLHFSLRLAP
jgi:Dolichyl-phosphate-mannose-protein mannosyltransferase